MCRAGDRVALRIQRRLETHPLLDQAAGHCAETSLAAAANCLAVRDPTIGLDGELDDQLPDMPTAGVVQARRPPTEPLCLAADFAGLRLNGNGTADLRQLSGGLGVAADEAACPEGCSAAAGAAGAASPADTASATDPPNFEYSAKCRSTAVERTQVQPKQ
jgi:hypothetical protein